MGVDSHVVVFIPVLEYSVIYSKFKFHDYYYSGGHMQIAPTEYHAVFRRLLYYITF